MMLIGKRMYIPNYAVISGRMHAIAARKKSHYLENFKIRARHFALSNLVTKGGSRGVRYARWGVLVGAVVGLNFVVRDAMEMERRWFGDVCALLRRESCGGGALPRNYSHHLRLNTSAICAL
jgi:hypothetical protein